MFPSHTDYFKAEMRLYNFPMKAAYLTDEGLEIREVDEPEPGFGEIVIRVKCALTDGTDLKSFLRGHPILKKGPFGHEYSGIVHRLGEGVEDFQVGDEVFGVNTAPCFKCTNCMREKFNLCENLKENMVIGAYAEYLLIPSQVVKINLFKKPQELPFHIAPMLEPLSCVFHALEKVPLEDINRILILGSGSISAMFSGVLSKIGKEVLIAGRNEEKMRKISENMGVKWAKIENLEGKFDLVIDTSANSDIVRIGFGFVNKGGYMFLFAGFREGEEICINQPKIHYDEIQILTSFHHTPSSVRKAYSFLLKNFRNFEFLVSGFYSLDDIKLAFENMAKGKGFKYAITSD